ncbi:putative FAD dependent oxidoreductase [Geopyxis carbonaria]|nr:putative FAD dependent oxidoreductase [Geopyxis carbonaria]
MKLFKLLLFATTALGLIEPHRPIAADYTVDVAIIGGGSTGCHAAVSLLDSSKSILVIESSSRLGGHAETYHAPSGGSIDIGVLVFHPIPLVRRYFGRFNITLTPALLTSPAVQRSIDFTTGLPVAPPVATDPRAALARFLALQQKYDFGFSLPSPVPAELAAPFSEMVATHDLHAALPALLRFAHGLPDILELPALYAFPKVPPAALAGVTGGAPLLTTAAHDIGALYAAITAHLGERRVLFDARVVGATHCRDEDATVLTVATPHGNKTVRARRVLFAAPPTPANAAPLLKGAPEMALLRQLRPRGYYTFVLRVPGLADNTSLINVDPASAYGQPKFPGMHSVAPAGVAGLFNVKFTSPTVMSLAAVKRQVISEVERIMGEVPEVVVAKSHSPFELAVGSKEVAEGFYAKMEGMQGMRGIWWWGAAWVGHDSSLIWSGLEKVLERVVASLEGEGEKDMADGN